MTKEKNKVNLKAQTRWMIENADKKSLKELLGNVRKQEKIGDILWPKLEKKGMSVEVMAQLAGFSRASGYKILNGTMRPGQDMLLRIAFVLKLNPEETQRLLKSGRCSLLTAEKERDISIIYGLRNTLSLGEMDELLNEYKFQTLVSPKK